MNLNVCINLVNGRTGFRLLKKFYNFISTSLRGVSLATRFTCKITVKSFKFLIIFFFEIESKKVRNSTDCQLNLTYGSGNDDKFDLFGVHLPTGDNFESFQ